MCQSIKKIKKKPSGNVVQLRNALVFQALTQPPPPTTTTVSLFSLTPVLPSILTSLCLPVIHAHPHLSPPQAAARSSLHPSLGCPEACRQEPGWLYKRSRRGDHSLLSPRLMFAWWGDCPFTRQMAFLRAAIHLLVDSGLFFLRKFGRKHLNL